MRVFAPPNNLDTLCTCNSPSQENIFQWLSFVVTYHICFLFDVLNINQTVIFSRLNSLQIIVCYFDASIACYVVWVCSFLIQLMVTECTELVVLCFNYCNHFSSLCWYSNVNILNNLNHKSYHNWILFLQNPFLQSVRVNGEIIMFAVSCELVEL